ncbi:MAG: hypothetical protein CVV61_08625 [Tenericutes bacterium HGW-Tenericutes-6]|nr:MAG: hypothetical protein CVV61_08625 [Tenericutes bacterium HGW-Tenericutes-6]
MMDKIVAVTGCPTGIAHTYMAAEMLENTGRSFGINVIVETNGAIGIENELKASDIKDAIAVIIASDIQIQKDRFIGKRLIEVGVSRAISDATSLINDAIEGKYKIFKG